MRAFLRNAESSSDGSEFVLELPSDVSVIEAAVAYLVERCRPFDFKGSRLTLNLRVGITEALANAILYGNRRDPAKMVRVEVALGASGVDVQVIDQGVGFDPGDLPDPTLPGNLLRAGGRGIFLMRHLMDEVEFNDRGNAIRLALYRDEARSTAAVE